MESDNAKLISDEYRAMLRTMHKPREDGGTWGATACRHIYDLLPYILRDGEPSTLLDYGSADGKFAFQAKRRSLLPNTEIIEYDPGIEGKEDNNVPAEFVLCVDVLEHIEPEMLDRVLADIARCTDETGLLQISLVEAKQILPDGRNAHLIVEKPDWWRNRLGRYFNILDHTLCGPISAPWLRVYVERR